jgi:hypothetical protein
MTSITFAPGEWLDIRTSFSVAELSHEGQLRLDDRGST